MTDGEKMIWAAAFALALHDQKLGYSQARMQADRAVKAARRLIEQSEPDHDGFLHAMMKP